MTDPTWVPLGSVIAFQRELIANHGGLARPPLVGDVEAALDRPGAWPLLPRRNKRVSLAIIDVFLRMNGLALTAEEPDAVDMIQALAAGEVAEKGLAEWIASRAGVVR